MSPTRNLREPKTRSPLQALSIFIGALDQSPMSTVERSGFGSQPPSKVPAQKGPMRYGPRPRGALRELLLKPRRGRALSEGSRPLLAPLSPAALRGQASFDCPVRDPGFTSRSRRAIHAPRALNPVRAPESAARGPGPAETWGNFSPSTVRCGPERAGVGGGWDRGWGRGYGGSATHCPFPLPGVLRPRCSRSSLQEKREPRR